MNILVPASAACIFSPVQDRALSLDGRLLRQSIEIAIAPPRPERSRAQQIEDVLVDALRDAYENDRVSVEVGPLGNTLELLSVLPDTIPLPRVVVEAENQIGLDWELGPRRVLALTIDATTYVGYSALLGHEPLHGRVPFAGAVPETVAFLLRRLHSVDKTAAA